MTISIIIPTLNDAAYLQRTLDTLDPHRNSVEIIVVDGGSSDETLNLLQKYPSIKTLSSPPSRGRQMNVGAEHARGEILLFLHADTLLTGNWILSVKQACRHPRFSLGAFRFKLEGKRLPYRILEIGVHIRSRIFRLPYGDQALFIKKEDLTRHGGFADLPLMEDVDLVLRYRCYGKLVILKEAAVSSPRNWERDGIVKRTLRNLRTLFRYAQGVPPKELANFYHSTRRAIILFCKEPIPGQVKTRLAASIGDQQAAHLYTQMLTHTVDIATACSPQAQSYIFYTPTPARETISHLLGSKHEYLPQSEGHLGQRMLSAFKKTFEMGIDQAIIIGTDCPGLTPHHLKKAFAQLDKHDVVFGTTEDGGYYLIGAKTPHPELLDETIPWSTEQVYPETLSRIKKLNLTHGELPSLRDLDTLDDLEYYRQKGYFSET